MNESHASLRRCAASGFAVCLLMASCLNLSAGDDKTDPSQSAPVEQEVFRPVLSAEPASPFAAELAEKPLKVKIFPYYNKLPQDGKCIVAIELQVAEGWHINANPADPDFLVPTTIELKTDQKVKLKEVRFPKSHKLKVEGSDQPYHVYDGKAIAYGLLVLSETGASEFAELEFRVRFQGCNSTQCLPPDLVVMKGKLPLAAADEELKRVNNEKFPKVKKEGELADGAESSEPKPDDGGASSTGSR
ncbi:MAG: protein-disulfide reductase DsbD family protein [Planctomycetaceae bacterium]